MTWLKRKKDSDAELSSKHYDFASMIRSARENDPQRFKKVQDAFKKNNRTKARDKAEN